MNNDIAKLLTVRCAEDDGVFIGCHSAVVPSTDRVRRIVDRSSGLWVAVRQPDHEVVQRIYYTTLQIQYLQAMLEDTQYLCKL